MNSDVSGQATNQRVWEGIYPTWSQACDAAQAFGGKGLDGEAWFQRITDQLIEYREEIRVFGVAMPPRPSNLPMLCAYEKPASIVDFGGSSGWGWDYLRDSGSGGTVSSYVVVETREVVDYMQRAELQDPPVRYQTMEEPMDAADLLYCNSVLQYLGSNDPLLSLVERIQPQTILLEDLVGCSGEDFFTTQLFRGAAIPYRFLGLQGLLDDLAAQGYFELVRYPYASPVKGVVAPMPMENFAPTMQLRYSSSILLNRTCP